MKHYRPHDWSRNQNTQRFIFATGIECSYPVICDDGKRKRIDQLAKCGHYERWREDLHLIKDLGIRYFRWGAPYYRIHQGPGKFDWEWTDQVMAEIRRLDLVPIIDLCHFGVPDWVGDFQNPDFPRVFTEYASAFSRRYPWVSCYTPINEMYITAEFSAYYGWWNEGLKGDKSFVTALKHVAKATEESMQAIIRVRPDALFVLCESSETTHARSPELMDEAEMFNERRFLSLDLCSGRMVSSGMYTYLRDNGMSEEEYIYFLDRRLTEHFVMGQDYYDANEKLLTDPDTREYAGDIFGYYVIAKHYYERYNLPVMHTETNHPDDPVRWLWKIWANVQELRHDGIPVCGMTWYSLTHQVDWDTALREENNRIYPVGLYDLDRKITPVGKTYKELIRTWKDIPLLPHGPLTLAGEWNVQEQE